MSALDQELRLRLSVQRALLGAVSSTLAAVSCGWNENDIVLEFLVDADFNDEDRERCEVVATEVAADFGHQSITTVFTSPPEDGPKIPIAKRWWIYERFQPTSTTIERKLEWPLVMQILALVDRLFQEKATWPELIKQIRAASETDIFTAEKIALSHRDGGDCATIGSIMTPSAKSRRCSISSSMGQIRSSHLPVKASPS